MTGAKYNVHIIISYEVCFTLLSSGTNSSIVDDNHSFLS